MKRVEAKGSVKSTCVSRETIFFKPKSTSSLGRKTRQPNENRIAHRSQVKKVISAKCAHPKAKVKCTRATA